MTTLKNICIRYKLEADKSFWSTPEEELERIYNGAGPDWMPEFGRAILTDFLRLYKGAFVIHDYDYDRADGSKDAFDISNRRMWINMIKILDKEYPLSDMFLWASRARWWLRARAAYRACDKFGWSAWIQK